VFNNGATCISLKDYALASDEVTQFVMLVCSVLCVAGDVVLMLSKLIAHFGKEIAVNLFCALCVIVLM